jgi:hypothetical protein
MIVKTEEFTLSPPDFEAYEEICLTGEIRVVYTELS